MLRTLLTHRRIFPGRNIEQKREQRVKRYQRKVGGGVGVWRRGFQKVRLTWKSSKPLTRLSIVSEFVRRFEFSAVFIKGDVEMRMRKDVRSGFPDFFLPKSENRFSAPSLRRSFGSVKKKNQRNWWTVTVWVLRRVLCWRRSMKYHEEALYDGTPAFRPVCLDSWWYCGVASGCTLRRLSVTRR